MERFWPKVNRDGPVPTSHPEFGNCWLWTSTLHEWGYGRIDAGVESDERYLYAHRLAWHEASSITLTSDDDVCHTCDIPACVRNEPTGEYTVNGLTVIRYGHLFVGTAAENGADMAIKDRSSRGDRNGQAKLTERDVLRIYDLFKGGQLTQREIARLFDVTDDTISDILTGTTWGYLGQGNIKSLGRNGNMRITPEIRQAILSEPRQRPTDLVRQYRISREMIRLIRMGRR